MVLANSAQKVIYIQPTKMAITCATKRPWLNHAHQDLKKLKKETNPIAVDQEDQDVHGLSFKTMDSALDAQLIKDITILDKEDASNAHKLLKLMLKRDGVTKIKSETGRNTSLWEKTHIALVREQLFQLVLSKKTTHGSISIPMLLRMLLLQMEVQSMCLHTLWGL